MVILNTKTVISRELKAFDRNCLSLGALGWGQIQITKYFGIS